MTSQILSILIGFDSFFGHFLIWNYSSLSNYNSGTIICSIGEEPVKIKGTSDEVLEKYKQRELTQIIIIGNLITMLQVRQDIFYRVISSISVFSLSVHVTQCFQRSSVQVSKNILTVCMMSETRWEAGNDSIVHNFPLICKNDRLTYQDD